MNPWLEKSVLSLVGLTLMGMMAFTAEDQVFYGRNDFVPLYNGTQLVGTPHLYSAEHNYTLVEERVDGINWSFRYTRLPYLAAVLWPLGRLPYQTAYLVWSLMGISTLFAFAALWRIPSGPDALMLTAFSLPAWQSVMNGQDVPYLLLWLALAVHYERRKKLFLAGVFLALCAAKYHLFTMIPLLMIAQHRWRMLQGFGAGAAGLAVISFAVAGPTWPMEYYHTLTDGRVHPNASIMPNLHGLFSGIPGSTLLEIAGSLAVIAATWYAMRHSSFLYGLAIALIGGLLISYHSYLSDCAILLPAATVVYSQIKSRWMQIMGALILTPFVYFLLILQRPAPYFVQLLLLAFFCGAVMAALRSTVPQQEEALSPT